jgi:hypothetical protein
VISFHLRSNELIEAGLLRVMQQITVATSSGRGGNCGRSR